MCCCQRSACAVVNAIHGSGRARKTLLELLNAVETTECCWHYRTLSLMQTAREVAQAPQIDRRGTLGAPTSVLRGRAIGAQMEKPRNRQLHSFKMRSKLGLTYDEPPSNTDAVTARLDRLTVLAATNGSVSRETAGEPGRPRGEMRGRN